MAALERDDVEAALRKKGFVERPGDHRFFELCVAGKHTGICTKTSRGTKYKTLSDPLVSEMAKQLHLTKKEFCQLVDCSLSGDALVALLDGRSVL